VHGIPNAFRKPLEERVSLQQSIMQRKCLLRGAVVSEKSSKKSQQTRRSFNRRIEWISNAKRSGLSNFSTGVLVSLMAAISSCVGS
jgi:hypothetical protein